ncbi:hypothetical protein JD844_003080 [Phrynosoma platyrhinos]|uniref:D-ribitol-5-phosphate cytidylyltransferase C-terminal domain-containing protein n=1 Tax=Phrynosoma platyrhinos TaxID=52577 RepID=A0ABQ7TCE3_PHRPL|nr:hypothetical protein JD844_003080 [Phrynosoma platyrhinos]
MPQAFLFDIIHQAYHQCSDYDFDYGTECLHLALKYSKMKAKLIEGPPDLWKVTYKRDLYAADSLIKDTMSQQICIISNTKEDATQVGFLLHEALKNHVKVVKSTSTSVSENANHLQNILLEQCYNFVWINDKLTNILETHQLVKILESTNASVLYPVVLILVHLNILENAFFSSGMQNLTKLAKEIKKKNILLYGLIIQYRKNAVQEEQERS